MERTSRWLAALAVTLGAGCPGPRPDPTPDPPTPSLAAEPPAPEPTPEVDLAGAPADPTDGEPSAAREVPEGAALPPASASQPPAAAAGSGREERLRPGVPVRPSEETLLGLEGCTRRGEQLVARVAVGLGQKSYTAEVGVGDEVHLGPARLRVLAVDERQGVRLRWERELAGGEEVLEDVQAGTDGRLDLPPMGFYRLPGGVVLALGNVIPKDGAPALLVLSAFPPGYERDPTGGYDRAVFLRPGARLEGAVARLRVLAVGADAVGLALE